MGLLQDKFKVSKAFCHSFISCAPITCTMNIIEFLCCTRAIFYFTVVQYASSYHASNNPLPQSRHNFSNCEDVQRIRMHEDVYAKITNQIKTERIRNACSRFVQIMDMQEVQLLGELDENIRQTWKLEDHDRQREALMIVLMRCCCY